MADNPGTEARPPAYCYRDYAAFLSDYVNQRKRRSASFSYAVLCRAAGLKSQSLVAMVAKGQRLPSREVLRKLNQAMKLSPGEREYLETLVDFQKAKEPQDRAYFDRKLRALTAEAAPRWVEVDSFAFIADWHHIVILEMVTLKDFVEDPAWIAARLGGRVTQDQAADALARLFRLGLLERGPGGRPQQTAENYVTETRLPNDAVAKYHRQMADRVLEAYQEQTRAERVISGTTVTIDRARLPEAIDALLEFRRSFLAEYASDAGDETYQLSLAFFRLTEPATRS